MQMGVQVLVTDPRELEKIRQRETDMTKERIGKLLKVVANVLGSWFKERSVSTFADMEGQETFESSLLGYADEVAEERIAAADVIMIRGTETTSAVLILRGAND
ncbi:CHAPERONIN [Salix purpurea]|uniref:CHAPERONIN n=1 Tax=Salix purpurea TaxID=77065 RepID=A0A9Q0PE28_SALPP|nr:CHAPERONIN [Salix purpurea]